MRTPRLRDPVEDSRYNRKKRKRRQKTTRRRKRKRKRLAIYLGLDETEMPDRHHCIRYPDSYELENLERLVPGKYRTCTLFQIPRESLCVSVQTYRNNVMHQYFLATTMLLYFCALFGGVWLMEKRMANHKEHASVSPNPKDIVFVSISFISNVRRLYPFRPFHHYLVWWRGWRSK